MYSRLKNSKFIGAVSLAVMGASLAFAGAASAQTNYASKECFNKMGTTRSEVLNAIDPLRNCLKEWGSKANQEHTLLPSQLHAYIKEHDGRLKSQQGSKSGFTQQNCEANTQFLQSLVDQVKQVRKFNLCDAPGGPKAALEKKQAEDRAKADPDAKAKADAAAKAKADADAKAKADADAKAKADAAAAKAKADADAKAKADADAKANASKTGGSGGGAPAGLKKCADDGGVCTVTGPWTGKYGTSSKMVDIKGSGTFKCLPKGWAKQWEAIKVDTGADDPAPGQAKACYLN